MELKIIPTWLIGKDKLQICFLFLLIYFLLEVSFTRIILTEFHYLRFTLDYSTGKAVLSCVVAIAFTVLLTFITVSDLIYTVLCFILLLLIYPATIMFRYAAADPGIMAGHGFFFLVVWGMSRLPISFKGPVVKESSQGFILLAIAIVAIIPFLIVFGPHLNWKNLLLQEIYESRHLKYEISNRYLDYTYSWLSSIIVPLVLVIFLKRRNYIIVALSIIMLIFLFLCGAHKSVFFGTVLLLVFYEGTYFMKVKVVLSGLVVFFTLAFALYMVNDNTFLSSLVTHRVFFIPAILDINYFDHFRETPLHWSFSVFKYFLDYPYPELPQDIMGKKVFGSPDVSANNGIISDGFMNLGAAGVIINVLITGAIFSYLNSLRIHPRFFGIIFLFLFNLVSSFLPVVLITHGGLLLLVLGQYFLKNSADIKIPDAQH